MRIDVTNVTRKKTWRFLANGKNLLNFVLYLFWKGKKGILWLIQRLNKRLR
jgi:hypothetical protein